MKSNAVVTTRHRAPQPPPSGFGGQWLVVDADMCARIVQPFLR